MAGLEPHALKPVRYCVVILSAVLHLSIADYYMSSLCGETVDVDGSRLVSQLSHRYDNGLDCVLTLETTGKNQQIVLHFDWLDLETYRDGCPDYLEVYDGDVMPSNLMKRFCGTLVPGDVISRSGTFGLRLVSDSSKTWRGFSLVPTPYYDGDSYSCNDTDTFLCDNKRCLNASLHCNGIDNCGDLSDEWFCIDYLIKWSELQIKLFAVGTLVAASLLCLAVCSAYYRFQRWYNRRSALSVECVADGVQLQKRRRNFDRLHYVPYSSLYVTKTTADPNAENCSRHTI